MISSISTSASNQETETMAKSATKENRKEAQERASSSTKKYKREEEPASEVETVLLEKLKSGIDSNPPWRSLFNRCKCLLDTKLKPSMERTARIRFRRRVHLLNNLMAKHNNAFGRLNIFFACQLKQIMDDIAADAIEQQQPGGEKCLIEDQTERVPSRATPAQAEPLGFFEEDLMAAENVMLCCEFSPTELSTAGIYGPEGVGKTTLAQLVFHSDKARSMFLPRIWICSEKDDAEESAEAFLTRRILVQLGFDPGESGSSANRSKIKSAMLEKRYIIILDGASEETMDWNKELMEVLRETLPKGTGGVVVVTGRAEEAIAEMVGGGGVLHRLLPLDKPVKCWKVYTAAAEEQGKEEELKSRLEKQKQEMEDAEGKMKAESEEEKERRRKAELDLEEKRKSALEVTKAELDEIHKVQNEVVKRSHGLPWASTLLGILRREIKNKPPTPTTTTIMPA